MSNPKTAFVTAAKKETPKLNLYEAITLGSVIADQNSFQLKADVFTNRPAIGIKTIGKLTQEDVFQIDADYNTTTIGKKTGKWILVYVWSSDTVGWIFSAFLKDSKPDYLKAKSFEKTLVDNTNFRVIDFNNWNPEDIPDKFYGNYSITKKEIIDANVGFTVYPMEIEYNFSQYVKIEILGSKKIADKEYIHIKTKIIEKNWFLDLVKGFGEKLIVISPPSIQSEFLNDLEQIKFPSLTNSE